MTSRKNRRRKRNPGLLRSRSAEGFTVVEMLVVLVIIGLMVGIGVLVYYSALRRIDARAAADMTKQDISKLYLQADSGVSTGNKDVPDQYRIIFNTNTDDPPNTYKMLKRDYVGPGANDWGAWTDIVPDKTTYKQVVSGLGGGQKVWIKPVSGNDLRITTAISGGGTSYNYITFVAMGATTCARIPQGGSSVLFEPAVQPMQITFTSASANKSVDIFVSDHGDVWLSE